MLDLDWYSVKNCILSLNEFLHYFIFSTKVFFRRDVFSSKDFSCWLGRLLLRSLLKYSEKESIFFYLRGLIQNSQTHLTHRFWALIFLKTLINASGRYRCTMIFRDGGTNVIRNWHQCIMRCADVNCWTIVDISYVWRVVILVSSDDFSKLPKALYIMLSNFLWSECFAGIAEYRLI